MIISELRTKGKEMTEELQLNVHYQESRDGVSRKASEGEEPTVQFGHGVGITLSPELYANIQRP